MLRLGWNNTLYLKLLPIIKKLKPVEKTGFLFFILFYQYNDGRNFMAKKFVKKILSEADTQIKEADQRKKSFNGMTAREWTLSSRSVWNDVSSARNPKQLLHGATYPLKLCDRVICMYSKKGDIVLDPFLGTGTTVISAMNNERFGIGIELSDQFFDISKQSIEDSVNLLNKPTYKLFHGDCSEEIKKLEDNSVQLTLTSPPYANLIHIVMDDRINRHKHSAFVEENNATTKVYSDKENDLGNMDLGQYKVKVTEIMKEIFKKTRPGGYNVWVVKDYRDIKHNIPYIDLHTIIAECGSAAGFVYHDLIIWDQNDQRALVLLGYPTVFYVNQNHSYLVVMRKGNR